ncbi:hypothetical protein DENSPDRAFT_835700 [Dentipellis sp. KUC8613]|nr:hypothetical protein DENSPDRAFT_835700 [Dentipellis sp. KUC8613]
MDTVTSKDLNILIFPHRPRRPGRVPHILRRTLSRRTALLPPMTVDEFPMFLDNPNAIPGEKKGSVWYEDGNIVLFCGSKFYRVYRGLLTEHSTYFANLLSKPLPSILRDGIAPGWQVIEITDIPQPMLDFFLNFLKSGHMRPMPTSLEGMGVYLRFARPLGVKYVEERCLEPLRSHYHDRAQAYEKWNGLDTIMPSNYNPLHVVNFAMRQEMTVLAGLAIVDAALFIPESDILAASEPRRHSPYAPGFTHTSSSHAYYTLLEHNKTSKEKLRRVLRGFSYGRSFGARPRCCSFEFLLDMLQHHPHIIQDSDGLPQLLFDMVTVIKYEAPNGKVCAACVGELDREVMDVYRDWFRGVPGELGIPDDEWRKFIAWAKDRDNGPTA